MESDGNRLEDRRKQTSGNSNIISIHKIICRICLPYLYLTTSTSSDRIVTSQRCRSTDLTT